MTWRIEQHDVSITPWPIEDESVQCVVTSPPYWGLRDYGTEGQIGLEPTPAEYVERIVAVFREVRRVLRKDGTVWLNLGDCYASTPVGSFNGGGFRDKSAETGGRDLSGVETSGQMNKLVASGLKPKDLVGIPWRVAFALQAPDYLGRIRLEKDRAWLAALTDGEGCITILQTTSPHGSGDSFPPVLQIRMCDLGPIEYAASITGLGNASPKQDPPSQGGNRGSYQWRLSGRKAAETVAEIYPYLIAKRTQALIAWNHQQVRETYQVKRGTKIPQEAVEKANICRDLIRQANRREPIVIPSWMKEPPNLYGPGWYLRSDLIWAKPNPMPESIRDRPTRAHEYVFLLTKSRRYFYDADAIRQPCVGAPSSWKTPDGWDTSKGNGGHGSFHRGGREDGFVGYKGRRSGNKKRDIPTDDGRGIPNDHLGRGVPWEDTGTGANARTVWQIATEPFPEAHFATFPTELARRCILAGTSEAGACIACGTPWIRRSTTSTHLSRPIPDSPKYEAEFETLARTKKGLVGRPVTRRETIGFVQACQCLNHLPARPCLILDPFSGAGTVALVADMLGRDAVGLELNPEYVEMSRRRISAPRSEGEAERRGREDYGQMTWLDGTA